LQTQFTGQPWSKTNALIVAHFFSGMALALDVVQQLWRAA
jgi:hypothetical protein